MFDFNKKKMQLETADFAPAPPPSELDQIHSSSLIRTNSLHYRETRRHPRNRKYIAHRTAVRADQATATRNMYTLQCEENMVKFGHVVF